ncbi:hypothetical protein [uncultured Trichococcus sp.]|uniref:hypothetical protein n=1 Tax=uncultured Trichococcus sp. TaxID=189665 RepID=UPI0029C62280|nr:hypothetical protein [uncultured Trichococcus sp.]
MFIIEQTGPEVKPEPFWPFRLGHSRKPPKEAWRVIFLSFWLNNPPTRFWPFILHFIR